jgi:DNA invertase Pin-like site-specific DNA recombinase
MTMTSTKVGVYIRVSTVEQNLDGQRLSIQTWLDGQGLTAVWYEDKSTGNNLDRAAFSDLQQDVFNGKVKTVVVYKLDRLSRSLRDGINVLTDWLDAGIRVVSVTQQLDFSGAAGKLIASVLFAVSEMETETRKERQADGIKAAKAKGVYKGRAKGSSTVDSGRVQELKSQGLKVTEIATSLGISRQSVYSHLGD